MPSCRHTCTSKQLKNLTLREPMTNQKKKKVSVNIPIGEPMSCYWGYWEEHGGGVSAGMAPQQLPPQKAPSSTADDSWTLQPAALHSMQAAGHSQKSLLSVLGWSASPPPAAVLDPFYMLGGAFENLPSLTSILPPSWGSALFRVPLPYNGSNVLYFGKKLLWRMCISVLLDRVSLKCLLGPFICGAVQLCVFHLIFFWIVYLFEPVAYWSHHYSCIWFCLSLYVYSY